MGGVWGEWKLSYSEIPMYFFMGYYLPLLEFGCPPLLVSVSGETYLVDAIHQPAGTTASLLITITGCDRIIAARNSKLKPPSMDRRALLMPI